MSLAFNPPPPTTIAHDRIVLVGGGPATLDLLRLATIRSDDVVLVAPTIEPHALAYARRFAVECRHAVATDADLDGATCILVAIDDMDAENVLVRAARRLGVPIHVVGRQLVSDFDLLAFLERRSSTLPH
jgi:siroheme synthase (precorrin-2 oxidase/ferrochelatase)